MIGNGATTAAERRSAAATVARAAGAGVGMHTGAGAATAAAADPELARVLRRLERVGHWMDGAFRVPGTRWRFGLDGLLGLLPGAGDTLTALVGSYVLLEAWRQGAPPSLIARMLGNLGLDWAVGTVPVVGDLFDFAFKSHRRNVELLRRHLDEAGRSEARTGRPPA